MNFSENSSDGNSSDDDEAADENKPKIDKLRSRAVPIGSKRRELYRDMSAYLRQDTVQNGTDANDNLRKEELLKNVVDTKTKSSSPNSLSFWKRLIPWNSIIWNVQVRYLKLIFSNFISIISFVSKRSTVYFLSKLQATYGPTVANYFMMLRSTMFLNLLNAALICFLIITPQVFDSKDPSDGRNETVQLR